ncbi:hypothetical protein PFAG_02513 [Plasmodium falciparum Santa Lucia]|uniref:Uncharacterized protein n=1 Tax=Plasmodium falciparum Santa Lucia TaxID=478859 RepID=W7FZP0_PLAFA|nr:hypothetical protein PFAG_02513 [Plasmodium falciparum Santa Lucia]
MYFPISFTFERKKKKKSDIALKNNKDTNDLFLMHILFILFSFFYLFFFFFIYFFFS